MNWRDVVDAARDWRPDAMLIAGAGCVSYGAWLVYAPAGFVVGGLLVMMAGWIDARGAR
jgi:hypothetical protein